jgi:hypothetical protein
MTSRSGMYILACQVLAMTLMSYIGHSCSLHTLGNTPNVSFTINGNMYDMDYFLVDVIYPEWPPFVKTVRNPIDQNTTFFARAQEATRKDIERAFGVLQSRWDVVRGSTYGWDRDQISNIMTVCIILHNMIIEEERDLANDTNFHRPGDHADPSTGSDRVRSSFVQRLHQLKNKEKHQ